MIAEPRPPQAMLDAIRAPFQTAFLEGHAVRVDPPAIQPLNLLLDLLGEAMRARLLVVQTGGAEACLRPDFTVPVAREHLERGVATGRYFYEGPAFRASPAGSSRPQEFLQIGLEAIGEGDAGAADAEIAALAWRAARAGGRTDLQLLMGDLGLFEAFCAGVGVGPLARARLKSRLGAPATWRAELDREPEPDRRGRLGSWLANLSEAQAGEVLTELWATGGMKPVGGRTPAEIARRLSQQAEAREVLNPDQRGWIERFAAVEDRPTAALEAVSDLAKEAGAELGAALARASDRLERLAAAGVPVEAQRLSMGFGRSFSYYDGFLFEVRSAALSPDEPVAAGGRYDGLLARLHPGAAASAVGCMVRPYRAWSGAVAGAGVPS